MTVLAEQNTPALYLAENLAKPDYIRQAILVQPHIEAVQIGFEPTLVAAHAGSVLGEVTDVQTGTHQELHAVIDAGGTKFGVLKVSNQGEQSPTYLLSQFPETGKDSDQATIVGIIPSQGIMTVGRKYDKTLPSTVSREHFQIVERDGRVLIADLNSSNGTDLLVQKGLKEYENHPRISPATLATKGLSGFIKRKLNKSMAQIGFQNPLEDSKNWAPSNDEVNALLSEAQKADAFSTAALMGLLEHRASEATEMFNSTPAKALVELAQRMMATANDATRAKVYEVVANNAFESHELTDVFGKWSAGDAFVKASEFLRILQHDSEAARAIAEHHIGGFHASQSGSILGVLKHDGLLSAQEARERGQLLSTGERTFSEGDGHGFISFADWRQPNSIYEYGETDGKQVTVEGLQAKKEEIDKSIKYFEPHNSPTDIGDNYRLMLKDIDRQQQVLLDQPNSLEAELIRDNFPIAYGVDVSSYDQEIYFPTTPVARSRSKGKLVRQMNSGVAAEFVVYDSHVPLAKLPVIAVPANKMSHVAQLFADHGKKVKIIDMALVSQKRDWVI